MKKFLFITLTSLLLFSCSSSDEPTNEETVYPPTTYFSLKSGNYWVYDVENSNGTTGRDSLYTANDTVISGNTYKKFKTKNAPNGFFSASFRNNSIRKVSDKLVLTGKANTIYGLGVPLNLDLTLSDFIVFQENAVSNTDLDSRSGSFVQEMQGLPAPYKLKISYILTTKAGDNLANHTVKGITFNNIKKVKSILNLKIDMVQIVGTNVLTIATLLSSQDVVISEQFYANNVGVVYVKTNTNYTFEPIVATLGTSIPLSNTTSQEEFLRNYVVTQ